MIEHKLLSSDFKEIKNIICVSGSILVILPLMLGMSIDVVIQLYLVVSPFPNHKTTIQRVAPGQF